MPLCGPNLHVLAQTLSSKDGLSYCPSGTSAAVSAVGQAKLTADYLSCGPMSHCWSCAPASASHVERSVSACLVDRPACLAAIDVGGCTSFGSDMGCTMQRGWAK